MNKYYQGSDEYKELHNIFYNGEYYTIREIVDDKDDLSDKIKVQLIKDTLSEGYAKGGEVMSFEEFKKNLPNDVMSPYFGEDDVRYIRKYDKYSDRQRYIRHGRSNLDKIGLKDAYAGYLEDMKQKTYAKGGKVKKAEKKQNNEIIMGGLAGVLLGLFLNR